MARRRALSGRPLLWVSSAAWLAACGGSKTPAAVASPVAPPPEIVTSTVCIAVTPAAAQVQIAGVRRYLATQRCTEVSSHGAIDVVVKAPGFVPYDARMVHTKEGIETAVILEGDQSFPPMGNLMGPPDLAMTRVCVDVTPADATIQVAGVTFTDRCGEFLAPATFDVIVSKPGFVTHSQPVNLVNGVELSVVLIPEWIPPNLRPVGNLMPPPDFTGPEK